MTAKQQRFVSEYLKDLNASQACLRAGYQSKNPNVRGAQLLALSSIANAIREEQTLRLSSDRLSADRILEEMRRLALSDTRGFFDERGNLKPIQDLTAEQGACLASVEVIQRNLTSGDDEVDTLHKVKMWDKVRALEMLGKHFALLAEKSAITGELIVKWEGE